MYSRIIALFSAIICIIIIIFGYISWNQKVDHSVTREVQRENTTQMNESKKDTSEKEETSLTFNTLKENISLLPESIQKHFKETYINEGQLKISLVGSASMGLDENGWSVQVKKALEEHYGADLVSIDIKEFDGTSIDFVESEVASDVASEGSNIIFLEGFTLVDNSNVIPTETTFENLETFMDTVKETNPDVAFIIQPPNPLANAANYPLQVEELSNFASENNIPYFNHWEKWPEQNSDEIRDLLNDESLPNEDGHKLWADAVIDYFTNNTSK